MENFKRTFFFTFWSNNAVFSPSKSLKYKITHFKLECCHTAENSRKRYLHDNLSNYVSYIMQKYKCQTS